MTGSCRLYLITPPAMADLNEFADRLRAALDAGDVACLQLRLKDASDDEILRAAERLLPLARARDVHFLLNDRPDLVMRTGADGVHIGQQDIACAEARALLGAGPTVGVTCHDSRDLALAAGDSGADYVAFGAFFPTRTKAAPTRAAPDILSWWRYATTVPCVAIGGITAENCAPLVAAGADFLAVSAAVWEAEDGPAAAVAKLNAEIAAAAQ